jgi:hypothetical protein
MQIRDKKTLGHLDHTPEQKGQPQDVPKTLSI